MLIWTANFPIIGSMFVRALPKVIQKLTGVSKAAGEKIKIATATIKGEPTPEQLAQIDKEKEEYENLIRSQQEAQQHGKTAAEVVSIIKEDPEKWADELGVKLSAEDLKNLKVDPEKDPEEYEDAWHQSKRPRRGSATKVEIPPKKVSPDEYAAAKASADKNLARSKAAAARKNDPTSRLQSAYSKKKSKRFIK